MNACPFRTGPQYEDMHLRVEVFSDSGEFVAGGNIEPSNDTRKVWRRFEPQKPLPARVRLRFRLHNCRLYSFRFPQ